MQDPCSVDSDQEKCLKKLKGIIGRDHKYKPLEPYMEYPHVWHKSLLQINAHLTEL